MAHTTRRADGPAAPARVRLGLEPLGDRLTPNAVPQITGFTATALGGGLYMFSGTVVDETPYGMTVEFSGPSETLQGLRVEANVDGSFELLICLATDGSDTGTVYATTEDDAFQVSAAVGVYVDPV